MIFCICGKLMTKTEIGFECICGHKTDIDGNEYTVQKENEARREAEKLKKAKSYRYRYPNMDDTVDRIVTPEPESETFDETFSKVPPSKRKQIKK